MKKEHIQFLERALIPLHKSRGIALYHVQLSYCISQYVEKDPETIVPIVTGLIRYWPWTSASKQVLFLTELEDILELCRGDQLLQIQDPLYKLLSICLGSVHFQVAERALYYWNSEHLCVNVLSQSKASVLLPYVIGPLSENTTHWNQSVESLSSSILKMYNEMDNVLYQKCVREYQDKLKKLDTEKKMREAKWKSLIETATASGINVDNLITTN